jgi:hypothetical protein
MIHSPGRTVRAAVATVTSVALVAGLGACSDGGSESPGGDEGTSATDRAAPGIPTKASMGEVKGRLNRDRRKQLKRRVTKTVDRWIDAAYVAGDYPRTDFSDAFAIFSKDAAALAKRDRGQMSNAKVGDRVDSVTAKRRRLRIDVLAHNGAAAGVTGRFVLVLDLDGEVRRTDRIAGNLYLTYTGKKWQVFGYDVKRGRVR